MAEGNKPLPPVLVAGLFPELLAELLGLLRGLEPEEWARPTVCGPWTVKDLALHLLGDEVGILGRRDRPPDQQRGGRRSTMEWERLVAFINEQNDLWVRANRRLSERLLCDLLEFVGGEAGCYFAGLDPFASGVPVDWVSPEPAPVWLDTAREFTERWHHQQQLREATGRPGLTQPRYLKPVLETFVRAVPRTYREVEAGEGTAVALTIKGEAGGQWLAVRQAGEWRLHPADGQPAQAEVVMGEDLAWRLFTRGVEPGQAQEQVEVAGDRELGLKMLETVSIIA